MTTSPVRRGRSCVGRGERHGRCPEFDRKKRISARSSACRPVAGALVAAALTLTAAASANAGNWTVTPSVSIYESYTSNARLNPSGEGSDSDFFTTLVPSLYVRGDSPRVKLRLDYSLEAIDYLQNTDLNQIRNNLNFASTLTVVPELLFLDGAASVQQVPTSGRAATSASPFASSTNLETVYVYNLSPYVKQHFGNFADGELRYTFNQVFSGNEGAPSGSGTNTNLSNSTTNRVTLTAVSGTEFKRLPWVVVADGSETSFAGDFSDTSTRLLQANGEYRLDREFGLLGSVGFEKISDPTFFPESEPDGLIGSVGLKYTPNAHTSLVLNANHRYNNNFLTGSANVKLGPQTTLHAGYTDQVFTSSQSQFFNNVSFLTTDEFGNFIDSRTEQLFSLSRGAFGVENDAFRDRNFDIGFHAVRGRNTFDADAFYQERNVFSTGEQDTSVGGAIGWRRQLSRVTDLSVTARYANQKFEGGTGGDDNQQIFGVGSSLVYHMNDALDGVLNIYLTRQLADNPDNEFSEAIVSVGLQKHF